MALLKVENISSGYGKKQVLFDVSFEVNQGDVVLLAGSNGSGKSTLLKTIFGLLPLWNNGSVSFNNENVTRKPTSELLKRGFLYIQQKNNLFENLTVRENLEMAGLVLDRKILKERIKRMSSVIMPYLNRTPMQLSGGEKQLVTLTMAMLHEPKMILLDEPLAGLSPQNIELVTDMLIGLNQRGEITLLIVEHRIKECLRIANKVLGFKLGKVFSEENVTVNFNVNALNSIFV